MFRPAGEAPESSTRTWPEFFWAWALTLGLTFSFAADAQEKLEEIIERGYPKQWLFCGPILSDLDGGIIEAYRHREAPLGPVDFLKSVGGVSQVRPNEGLTVVIGKDTHTWRRCEAEDGTVDLSALFEGLPEGVVYAAFHCVSKGRVDVLCDLQTPLGARVWVNGLRVREPAWAPFESVGVDRFLLSLRSGPNLVLLQLPLVSWSVLGEATGIGSERIVRDSLKRPLLRGTGGYAFAVRLLPVEPLGALVFVPRLQGGTTLTLFNPEKSPSPPVAVRTTVPGVGFGPEQTIPPIAAQSAFDAVLAIPGADATEDRYLEVDVTLITKGARAKFTSSLSPTPSPPGAARVYWVISNDPEPLPRADQRTEINRRLEQLDKQITLARAHPDYGFLLGHLPAWSTFLHTRPDRRQDLVELVRQARCAPQPAYGPLDARIVSGELLVRNLAYGQQAARAAFGQSAPCFYAWDPTTLCPQMPQILSDAGTRGVVTNFSGPDSSPLVWLLAPDRTRLLCRNTTPLSAPASAESFLKAAASHREPLLALGLDADLLVGSVPEKTSQLLNELARLKHGSPSVRVTGGGGAEFLERTLQEARHRVLPIPLAGPLSQTCRLGEVLAQPGLKQAHARLESLTLSAEKFATFASLLGAPYPEAALDYAWRQALYCGTPDRVGFAATPSIYLDLLGCYRQAAAAARGVLQHSLEFLADQVDTRSAAPARTAETYPIVVFNPSSRLRTDICRFDLGRPPTGGLTLQDEAGKTVDLILDRQTSTTIWFVAEEVPALGYRTYYLMRGGRFPSASEGSGNTIENDFFRVVLDPAVGGSIVSLVHKPTATEFVHGQMNQVVVVQQQPGATERGGEIGTTEGAVSVQDSLAEVVIEKSDVMQRATITAPLADGVITREMTLWQGVPRIECRTRLHGVTCNNLMVAAVFQSALPNTVPIFGERFGAQVGPKSPETFRWPKTRGEPPTLRPALGWVAVSPNDALLFGADIAVPLQPAAIVIKEGAELRRAADTLLEALISRGIPAAICPEESADSGQSSNPEEVSVWNTMRFVLDAGGLTETVKRSYVALPGEVRDAFRRRLAEGASLFLYDDETPKAGLPVPTLILAGDTPETVRKLVESVAGSIAAHGSVQFPLSDYVPPGGRPRADMGLALLYPGAALASLTEDGTLLLGLCRGGEWDENPCETTVDPCAGCSFRYAIYPFQGDWRRAGVPHEAHAYGEPLLATETGFHGGSLPSTESFLTVSDPGLVITAVTPRGLPAAATSGEPPTARRGMMVRGYEPYGERWQGSLRCFAPLHQAQRSDLLGSYGTLLPVSGKEVSLGMGGFDLETIAMTPAAGITGTASRPADLGTVPAKAVRELPLIYPRYWLHNEGAAPEGFHALNILVDGNLSEPITTVTVTVSNNLADRSAGGQVVMKGPEGWELVPAQFDYHLVPQTHLTREISVVRTEGASPSGGIIAETISGNRRYWDVLQTEPAELELEIQRTKRREVLVTVRNPMTIDALGFLDLLAPQDFWPEWLDPGPGTVTPARVPLQIEPSGEQRGVFRISGDDPPWLALKLAANGRLIYRTVPASPGEKSAASR